MYVCLDCKGRRSWSFREVMALQCPPWTRKQAMLWGVHSRRIGTEGIGVPGKLSGILGRALYVSLAFSVRGPSPSHTLPTTSEALLSPTRFLLTPTTLQMRLCGLRGMMHYLQMPRTSPPNCSTRTLWRDWVQVGQAPLNFSITWKREEGGRVHATRRVRLQVWVVPVGPETRPAPLGRSSGKVLELRLQASFLRSGFSLDLLTWAPPAHPPPCPCPPCP